ncbi:unnamed protein product [Peronospora belbahrii]|uniref:Uncharacterized protein n=1 Tax=Peronospora belbahrii TaxID=622444 RepID=A0ABN8DD67_9STRA|nr:unnamed protein product [Peronospora belbahrii]
MAGVLNATLVIDTAQQMAKGQKKEIQEHSLVQSVANEQQTRRSLLVVVILADGMDVCGYQCIPTAGAWTGNVLKSVPDKVTLQPIATSKRTRSACRSCIHSDKFSVSIKYGYSKF